MRTIGATAAAVCALAVAGSGGGQASTMRITSPTSETAMSGPTRIEIALEPASALKEVRTATFTVDGRLACMVEKAPFVCTADPGEIVRVHHVRVVVTMADGTRRIDNVHTKDVGYT